MKAPTDPFCQHLLDDLATFAAELSRALPLALHEEREDLAKLVAGLAVVMQFASGKAPPTGELNAVLRTRLGNGYSWLNCMQFLSGERARATFAKHEAVLRTLVEPDLADFAVIALPTMPQTLSAMMAETRGGRAAQTVRAQRAAAAPADPAA